MKKHVVNSIKYLIRLNEESLNNIKLLAGTNVYDKSTVAMLCVVPHQVVLCAHQAD